MAAEVYPIIASSLPNNISTPFSVENDGIIDWNELTAKLEYDLFRHEVV